MSMASIIAFFVSLTALVIFLAFKVFEHSRNFKKYNTIREKGDIYVVAAIANMRAKSRSIERHLSISNIVSVAAHYIASKVAHTARKVETHAQDVTRKISRNGNGKARETKSSFLEEVSTHKEGLDTERVRRETSLTKDDEK